jgi:hypothetical protein
VKNIGVKNRYVKKSSFIAPTVLVVVVVFAIAATSVAV